MKPIKARLSLDSEISSKHKREKSKRTEKEKINLKVATQNAVQGVKETLKTKVENQQTEVMRATASRYFHDPTPAELHSIGSSVFMARIRLLEMAQVFRNYDRDLDAGRITDREEDIRKFGWQSDSEIWVKLRAGSACLQRLALERWKATVHGTDPITLRAQDIDGVYDGVSRCHAGEYLSIEEQSLAEMNLHQNGQWSSTTSSSSLSQPFPASSAASLHLLTQPPPAVESRKTLVLASFQAQIEEEDKKPKLHAETDPLRTIPEFVVVRALPSTALKPNHNETDDYNIAHFKQTISRKMLRQAGRDQESSDVMKLSEAITAGLLDGDLRTDVTGLPTQYQLGIVGYAVMDGVITDHAKILPLIAEVKRAKANEDWEKNILWNYNSMVYGKQGYSEGLASLDAFLGQCCDLLLLSIDLYEVYL
ncbi:hypothetical protein Pelo_1051 [Pelomyxa schiedti]|nr:hypothetical protein Pelo_1051 [Pelomyxa schiedti]